MNLDIVSAAEFLSAASVLIAVIVGGYKLYDKALDRIDRLEAKTKSLEDELTRIRKEDTIVICALRACLDGLHQQGCNGRVTEAIEILDDHINKAAHHQE